MRNKVITVTKLRWLVRLLGGGLTATVFFGSCSAQSERRAAAETSAASVKSSLATTPATALVPTVPVTIPPTTTVHALGSESGLQITAGLVEQASTNGDEFEEILQIFFTDITGDATPEATAYWLANTPGAVAGGRVLLSVFSSKTGRWEPLAHRLVGAHCEREPESVRVEAKQIVVTGLKMGPDDSCAVLTERYTSTYSIDGNELVEHPVALPTVSNSVSTEAAEYCTENSPDGLVNIRVRPSADTNVDNIITELGNNTCSIFIYPDAKQVGEYVQVVWSNRRGWAKAKWLHVADAERIQHSKDLESLSNSGEGNADGEGGN